jgi:hypothetical protein
MTSWDLAAAAADDGPAAARLYRLALALGALPFVVLAVAIVLRVGDDWLPVGDRAMIELHVRDVGQHEVLTGLYSRIHWQHPGPVLFYLAAPLYWLTGGASIALPLTAILINAASVLAMLAIARRRGGLPLVLCTLVALLALARTMGPVFLADIWNLSVPVLPFALVVYLAWSMLAGETWALPVGAAVTTFTIHTHVGFALIAGPVFAVGAGGLVLRALRQRDGLRWTALVKPGLWTVVTQVILWAPAAIDAMRHEPSNLGNMITYFRNPGEEGHAFIEGWRVVVGQFTLPPEWLTGKRPPTGFGATPFIVERALPLLLVPAALAAVALWRWTRDGRRFVVLLGVLLVSGIVSVMRTVGLVQEYRMSYSWIFPTMAAVAVLWAIWWLVRDATETTRRRVMAGFVAAAVTLSAILCINAGRVERPEPASVAVVETLVDPVRASLEDVEGVVVIDDLMTLAGPFYSRALVLQLRRAGIDVRVRPGLQYMFSWSLLPGDEPIGAALVVAQNDDVPSLLRDPELSLVARWTSIPVDQLDDRVAVLEGTMESLLEDPSDERNRLAFLEAQEALFGGYATPAYDVAVFRRERP